MNKNSLSLVLTVAIVVIAVAQTAVAQCPSGTVCLFDEGANFFSQASDWNGFGIMHDGQSNSDELRPGAAWEAYIDDLSYTVETGSEDQTFDSNAAAMGAGWAGRDNGPGKTTTTVDSNGVLLVDPSAFGYKNSSHTAGSAGEAGGIMARGTSPTGWYADTTIGSVDMTTTNMQASGKIYLDGSTADNGIWIGWLELAQAPDETREEVFGLNIIEGSDPISDMRSARIQLYIEGDNGQGTSSRVAVADTITANDQLAFSLSYSADTGTARGSVWVIPEPSTLTLGGMALLGGLCLRRRKSQLLSRACHN